MTAHAFLWNLLPTKLTCYIVLCGNILVDVSGIKAKCVYLFPALLHIHVHVESFRFESVLWGFVNKVFMKTAKISWATYTDIMLLMHLMKLAKTEHHICNLLHFFLVCHPCVHQLIMYTMYMWNEPNVMLHPPLQSSPPPFTPPCLFPSPPSFSPYTISPSPFSYCCVQSAMKHGRRGRRAMVKLVKSTWKRSTR